MEANFLRSRRAFNQMALAGAMGAPALFTSARAAEVPKIKPGIKLCVQSSATPTDDVLLFIKQLGVEYVSVGSTPELRTAAGFKQITQRYAAAGITVWNIGNTDVHNMPEVTLNLPGRDAKIAAYKQYLRNLAQAGIHYTTYAHMGNGIWSSGRQETRSASARAFDQSSPEKKGVWAGQTWTEPLSHGRVFTEKEIWDNHLLHPASRAGGRRTGHYDRHTSR